jgi:hypothetical protein
MAINLNVCGIIIPQVTHLSAKQVTSQQQKKYKEIVNEVP